MQFQNEAQKTVFRRETWGVLIALCKRLEAMRECVLENVNLRLWHARRKTAAVKIAIWYKGCLQQRRYRGLLEACQRMHIFSIQAMTAARKRVRRRCALRILAFMKCEAEKNLVAASVEKLRFAVVCTQRAWRTRIGVRDAQVVLLMLQLTKFETALIQFNRRKATANNADVASAVARRRTALHEEMRETLLHSVTPQTMSPSRPRKVKMDDEDETMTPQQLLFLNTLTLRLPKAVKEQANAVSFLFCFTFAP